MAISSTTTPKRALRVAAIGLLVLGQLTNTFAADRDRIPAPPSCSIAPGQHGVVFPQAALDAKILHGSATVSFFVSPTGQIHDVKLESVSDPVFADNALAAVKALSCVNPADMEMPSRFTIDFRTTTAP